jgi:nitrate/nitrite-specific signal transduction histidine kinase
LWRLIVKETENSEVTVYYAVAQLNMGIFSSTDNGRGQDNEAGLATHYGLDNAGLVPRWE